MFSIFHKKIAMHSSVAEVIISMSLMLFLGFLMTRLTKKLKLPNVTAYIVTGIIIGPYVLDLIPDSFIKGTEFLPDLALAFIAFSTGEFFKLDALKSNGIKVLIITLFESLLSSILVFILSYFILKLNLPFAIVLSALASATAPASTVMTIRQTKAKGDFVDTLLQVVALDDVVGLIAYSIAISAAVALTFGTGLNFNSIIVPLFKNFMVVLLGAGFGFLLKAVLYTSNSTDNRLIIALAVLFGFCGISAFLDISPLLGCMMIGTVYINISNDDRLFRQLNYFSPPLLLLFFVRSGISFDLNALIKPSGSIGSTPLLLVGVLYFIVRIIGKYAGAYIGCKLANKPSQTTKYLGLALIPQAGVAIGLAALGARTLKGDMGNALQTIILASSVLYELIGPACAKLSLYLSGSYAIKDKEVKDEITNRKSDDEKGYDEIALTNSTH